VSRSILDRLPATLSLTVAGMTVAIVIGVTAGMVAAQRAGSLTDRLVTSSASLGLAVPTFWLGLLLIVIFTFKLNWLPPTGYSRFGDGVADWLRSITMPAFALGMPAASVLARQTRSALLEVMQRDFIRAARARGASRRSAMMKHGMKNAAAPIATVLALELIAMLGGSVIIEALFNIPGLGAMTISAVQKRDLPVVQGVVIVVAVFVVLANLAVDIVYGYANPRGRRQ
jgi:peptide/nickel transport system permease protein